MTDDKTTTELELLANLVRSYKTDFPRFAKDQLKIETKEGNLECFQLNEIQLRIEKVIKDLEDKGIPVRIKILKARRLGCSTYIAGRYFRKIWMAPGHHSEIVTHLADASNKILKKLQLFSHNIDKQFQLTRKNSNSSELIYVNGAGLTSSCGIKTAESPDALRSSTNQSLHLSEVAFWPQAEKCALASLQTVSYLPGTSIIFETTANGMSGYFYDFWYSDNEYIPLFYGWQEYSEYRMPVPDGFKVTNEETVEMKRLNLTVEQIVWRRWCIASQCGGSLTKFMQEYPGTPEDAFQASGECRFSLAGLRRIESKGLIHKSLFTGSINVTNNGKVDLFHNADRDSTLQIFSPYKKRRQYVLFTDVSEGITNDKGKTGDMSVTKVFDLEDNRQVAEWFGRLEPSDIGLIEVYLAKAYGACIIVQEINNHGHAAMVAINKIAKYPRELIFSHSNVGENEINGTTRLGWLTSSHTRAIAIDDLATAVQRETLFRITKQDLKEMYSFTSRSAGRKIKFEASPGAHDDRVITIAIACHLLSSDVFLKRYRLKVEDWQVCKSCKNYARGKCLKLGIDRDIDDVCRMFSSIFDDYRKDSGYEMESLRG